MKMRLPKKDVPTLSVSVEQKSYTVDKSTNTVDLPNSLPPALVKHLLGMGWMVADSSAEQAARGAGITVGPNGQVKA